MFALIYSNTTAKQNHVEPITRNQSTPSLYVSWYKRQDKFKICVVCFGPISSPVTNHLVRVKKISRFGSKYLFWCHDHGNSLFWSTQKQLEMSPGVIKYIQWCDANTQPRWLVMKPPPSPDITTWFMSWRKVSTDRHFCAKLTGPHILLI